MKRITLAIVFCLLFSIIAAPVVYAETTVIPRLDNISYAQCKMTLSNNTATIKVGYVGFDGCIKQATITTKLQKQFLFFFWTEEKTWYDTSTEDSATFTHNYGVSSGTYRIEVTYEIIGNDGTTDSFTEYREASC